MIKVIAVDDEPVALDIISSHAKKVSFIDLQATFLSATEALNYVSREEVQLIFLDIQMPDLSGLEFAELIGNKAQIVFTTAYSQYALNGFDLAVTDYLLKPINFSRFMQCCQLVQNRMLLTTPVQPNADNYLFVKDGYEWIRVNTDNLLYVEGQDNYVSLYEVGKHTMTRITLSELLGKLPQSRFIRVHKSYIVAIAKIDKIERHQVIICGAKIPVSPPYQAALLNAVKKLEPYS